MGMIKAGQKAVQCVEHVAPGWLNVAVPAVSTGSGPPISKNHVRDDRNPGGGTPGFLGSTGSRGETRAEPITYITRPRVCRFHHRGSFIVPYRERRSRRRSSQLAVPPSANDPNVG